MQLGDRMSADSHGTITKKWHNVARYGYVVVYRMVAHIGIHAARRLLMLIKDCGYEAISSPFAGVRAGRM